MDDVFEYEAVLDKNSLPQNDFLVSPAIPVKASFSILDKGFSSLVKMDIEEVRKTLIEEISFLELESNEIKDDTTTKDIYKII